MLDAFFDEHNPTQLNRGDPDFGAQYRSVIFYRSPEQQQAAAIARLSAEHKLSKPFVTQVIPADTFWPAEEYRQKCLEKCGPASCHI
jgi:peptide-methionine (S)-S-oxide reductase